MSNRKPLVQVSGQNQELPTSDRLDPTLLDETSLLVNNWNDAYNIAIGTSKIVSGNATWSGSGLIEDITPSAGYAMLVWYILGVRYTANSTQVTHTTADATNPRIDVIYFDNAGAVGILAGTPAASPVKPVVDFGTQIELTSVYIAAGATTPIITGNTTIYDENIEFTGSSTNGTVNFANTTAPKSGTKHISCGAFTNNQNITFTDSGTHDASTYQYLRFALRLNATFTANAYLVFYFANGTSPVSNQVSVTTGNFGYSRTVTGSYQIVAIPISAFVFTNTTFNRLYILMKGTNATGFYLDTIQLQGGITIPPANGVQSFNSRTGNVIPQSGDYTAAMVSAIPLSYLDPDGTLAANSDSKVATQKAVKTYVNTKQSALTGSQGDIIYFSGSNTISNLTKDTTATRYLSNQGSSNNPSWSQVNLANGVTGFLAVGNIVSSTNADATHFLRGDGTWSTPSAGTPSLTSTQFAVGDGSNLLAGSGANLTYASSIVTLNKSAIGITRTDGLVLQNTTAATSILEQYSPSLVLEGRTWLTTSGGSSNTNKWAIFNRTSQGGSSIASTLVFQATNNSGVYSDIMTLAEGTGGALTTAFGAFTVAVTTPSFPSNASGFWTWGSGVKLFGGTAYNLQLANPNTVTTDQNYKIDAYGPIQALGSVVIGKIPTPSSLSASTTGVAGTTTITYKVVAKLINGATTDAGTVTISTANATLTTSNFVTVTGAFVPGAYQYLLYRSATNGTSPTTLGLIGTQTVAGATIFIQDKGTVAGAGEVAPATNTSGNIGVGVLTPTASVHIKAGVSDAGGAPIKLVSGTNLTTPENGVFEYDGTNLFFTRTGATRETNWCGNSGATAPATNVVGVIVDYYGSSATRVLTTPNSWASVNIGGTTYKIPLYT